MADARPTQAEAGGAAVSPWPTTPSATRTSDCHSAIAPADDSEGGTASDTYPSSDPTLCALNPTLTHTHTHPNPFATPLDLSCPHYARLGSGRPYGYFLSPTIRAHVARAAALCAAFNHTAGRPAAEGAAAIRALLGEVGEGAGAVPPLSVCFGTHVKLGKGVWLGPGAVFQDHGGITIGANTLIGAQLTIATVHHPLSASLRTDACPERCEPVVIGADAWLGARVTILPGVRIGDRCVIGAGSVVTKSTGEGELWLGVPARCVRVFGDDEERGKVDWQDMPQGRGPEVLGM